MAQYVIFALKNIPMKSILLLFLLFIFSYQVSAQTELSKSQKILNKLSKKMKGLKSFYLEYSANIKNEEMAQNDDYSGKGWVKNSKYYATYGDNTIICNGIKTWTIIAKDKEVYESDNSDDEDGINPKKLMTIWETGFKNKFIKEDKISGETVSVIDLYPKNPKTADYNTIVLYISKSKNELKKAVMKSNDGTIMTYSVTKFTSNPEVKDTKFAFDKKNYPGYKVIKN
jgi:outer membrane lipoprotein-sorting protein